TFMNVMSEADCYARLHAPHTRVRNNGRVTQEPSLRIADVITQLRERFENAGLTDPTTDVDLLIGHVIGESRGRVQALAILGESLDAEQYARLQDLAELRADRVPLQHLTGRAPFRSIELEVGPGVFVPRPETEGVAQFAIDALQAAPTAEPLAVDLCTGSGAIAISL